MCDENHLYEIILVDLTQNIQLLKNKKTPSGGQICNSQKNHQNSKFGLPHSLTHSLTDHGCKSRDQKSSEQP